MKTKVTVISEFLDIRVETLFAEVLYFQCFFSYMDFSVLNLEPKGLMDVFSFGRLSLS